MLTTQPARRGDLAATSRRGDAVVEDDGAFRASVDIERGGDESELGAEIASAGTETLGESLPDEAQAQDSADDAAFEAEQNDADALDPDIAELDVGLRAAAESPPPAGSTVEAAEDGAGGDRPRDPTADFFRRAAAEAPVLQTAQTTGGSAAASVDTQSAAALARAEGVVANNTAFTADDAAPIAPTATLPTDAEAAAQQAARPATTPLASSPSTASGDLAIETLTLRNTADGQTPADGLLTAAAKPAGDTSVPVAQAVRPRTEAEADATTTGNRLLAAADAATRAAEAPQAQVTAVVDGEPAAVQATSPAAQNAQVATGAAAPEQASGLRRQLDVTAETASGDIDVSASEAQAKTDLNRIEQKTVASSVMDMLRAPETDGTSRLVVESLYSTTSLATQTTSTAQQTQQGASADLPLPPDLQTPARMERQIAPQIAAAASTRPHGGVIDLTLDPPELGRIEIVMELTEHNVRATISTERTGTGDLLRKHADVLTQQLSDAGFGTVDLSFGSFGQPASEQSDANAGVEPWAVAQEQTQPADPQVTPRAASISASTVDLRL